MVCEYEAEIMKTVMRHQQCQEDGEILMLPESEKSLLRAVTRGTKSVRAQPNPGQKSDQRQTVKNFRVAYIAWRTNQDVGKRPLFPGGDCARVGGR